MSLQLAYDRTMPRSLAIYFAKLFKVSSFAYQGMANGTRGEVFESMVSKPVPRVVEHSEFKRMMFR
jgi:hypothetical protein